MIITFELDREVHPPPPVIRVCLGNFFQCNKCTFEDTLCSGPEKRCFEDAEKLGRFTRHHMKVFMLGALFLLLTQKRRQTVHKLL